VRTTKKGLDSLQILR